MPDRDLFRSETFRPETFRPEAIDAETAAFNADLARQLAGAPRNEDRPIDVARRERESGEGVFGPITLLEQAVERRIPGPGGEVPLRLLVPDAVHGVYLYLHGGGWVFGRAHLQDDALWRIATEAGVAVVSVDYRLAPEHPYPAGPDDCEAAAVWLARNALAEFGTDRLVIGGGSAGAHLAAVTLLRMRDRHGYTGFAGADLLYGIYDLSMTPSQRLIGRDSLVIDARSMAWFYDQFVPTQDRRDTDVSPLHAELADMPPALFTVGTQDPLLDDSLFMCARWIAAGNEAELAVYPGGVHGFTNFAGSLPRRANEQRTEFIAEAARERVEA